MVVLRRSKKMAPDTGLTGLFGPKMGPALNRRQIIAAFGAAATAGLSAWPALAQAPATLTVRARPSAMTLGSASATAWTLDPAFLGSHRRNDQLTVDFQNELPVAVVPRWLIGAPELVALSALAPVPAQGRTRFTLPLRQAGTQLLDLRLGEAGLLPLAAFAVAEPDIVAADRDEFLLIEEWRLGKDGVLAPGKPADDTSAIFTANRRPLTGIAVSSGQVLRLRLVNASPRSIVALKIEDHPVSVIAIDGQPCERFPARDGELMLAPGARMDVLVDARNAPESTASILLHDGRTARPIARIVYDKASGFVRRAPLHAGPLPSNGLPDKIDLQRALRVTFAFDGNVGDWIVPTNLSSLGADALRVKRGRAVVVTLTNRATTSAVFHLHGHHARLLDRLDDGWKPFWLDTVTVAAGQTQRIAFVPDVAGAWLIEAMLAQWSAPRLARRFTVEA